MAIYIVLGLVGVMFAIDQIMYSSYWSFARLCMFWISFAFFAFIGYTFSIVGSVCAVLLLRVAGMVGWNQEYPLIKWF